MPKQGRGGRAQNVAASGGSRFISVCSLLFIFIGITGYYIYGGWLDQEAIAPPTSRSATPTYRVQRQRMGNKSYREIAEGREPVVLTQTIADRWPARKTFTTSFLAKKLTHVLAYRQEKKRSFMTFHDNKPLEPLVDEQWEDFNMKINVTIPEVLQWGAAEEDHLRGPYLYFSQDIAILRPLFPDIIGYVQPINDVILSEENVQINLWVGRAGIVTHTHYDCTYNFFVQLQGRKRFTLFPPNQTLYLYPCLHPHYGHSQVDILEPNLDQFPLFERTHPVVAEVGPGDMLVVPPFWFHHVETLSESVSVNVWSDAPEYALLNEIYRKPIPFEEHWSWEELAKATKIYIEMILGSVAIEDTQAFTIHLLHQRYEPVVGSGNLRVNSTLLAEMLAFCSQVDWEESPLPHQQRLRYRSSLVRGIELLRPLFSQIPVRATLDICVVNYIEHLVHNIVGLEHVYPFLKFCATL